VRNAPNKHEKTTTMAMITMVARIGGLRQQASGDKPQLIGNCLCIHVCAARNQTGAVRCRLRSCPVLGMTTICSRAAAV
jgi:hypothetical protein